MKAHEDPIRLRPTTDGWARAWQINIDAQYAAMGVPRESGNDVMSWIIEAPWAHAFWHSYWLNLIHLRPVPGAQYKIYLPGATHELTLAALNPDMGGRQQMIEGTGTIPTMHPLNFAAQMKCANDAEALQRVEAAIGQICSGQLSPDTDHRRAWIALFGDNMIRPDFR